MRPSKRDNGRLSARKRRRRLNKSVWLIWLEHVQERVISTGIASSKQRDARLKSKKSVLRMENLILSI